MELVTVEKMKGQGDVYKAIEWAQKQKGEYPERPKKPNLPSKHTSLDATQYVDELFLWEKQMIIHNGLTTAYMANENSINDVIIEYIKDMSGLADIPKQYQEKVYSKAYEDGHSGGFYAVYQELDSLIDIFN